MCTNTTIDEMADIVEGAVHTIRRMREADLKNTLTSSDVREREINLWFRMASCSKTKITKIGSQLTWKAVILLSSTINFFTYS